MYIFFGYAGAGIHYIRVGTAKETNKNIMCNLQFRLVLRQQLWISLQGAFVCVC